MLLYASVACWIKEIPNHLKMKEMCNKAVGLDPRSLAFVPDDFITQGICNEAVCRVPGYWNLYPVSKRRKRCVKEPLKMIQAP